MWCFTRYVFFLYFVWRYLFCRSGGGGGGGLKRIMNGSEEQGEDHKANVWTGGNSIQQKGTGS